MFTKQDQCTKNMEPCLTTLQRIHKQNSDLLDPIKQLTDEVICTFLKLFNPLV